MKQEKINLSKSNVSKKNDYWLKLSQIKDDIDISVLNKVEKNAHKTWKV